MTLLREPRAFTISNYKMWPPTLPINGTKNVSRCKDTSLTPINDYLSDGHMHGLHTMWLTKSRVGDELGPNSCPSDLAARRLCTFDHVSNITTMNLSWFFQALRIEPYIHKYR